MDDRLSEVHDALNSHEWIQTGEFRRCECGRVQMTHIQRDYFSFGWVDCMMFGQRVVDEDLYNVAITKETIRRKGMTFW